MIRTYFGIEQDPFHPSNVKLLPSQDEILSTLRVHCQQGGLCVLVGEPGTGKSVIKHALQGLDPKMLLTPTVNRTLHTYHSVLRTLCEDFNIEPDGLAHKCGPFHATAVPSSPRPSASTSRAKCLHQLLMTRI